MEKIIYKGVDGVFIPNNEFEYMQDTIKHNGELLKELIKELQKNNINSFDYLLNLK